MRRIWKRTFVSLLVIAPVGLLGACDSEGGGGGQPAASGGNAGGASGNPGSSGGISSCGSVACQPGQFCMDANLEMCVPGCLSDANCAANQECIKEAGVNEGTCQEVGDPDPQPNPDPNPDPGPDPDPDPGPGPDPDPDPGPDPTPSECDKACDKAFECGFLDAPMLAGCKVICDEVDAQMAQALVDCVGAADCGDDLPACFDSECGGSYECPDGMMCDEDFGECY